MGRSKRYRIAQVTGEGNRAFARQDVNQRMETERSNAALKKIVANTSHKIRVVNERGKTRAECLDCSFNIAPRSAFQLVLFDAEEHGRISQLDCAKKHEMIIKSWISAIRNGSIVRSDLG